MISVVFIFYIWLLLIADTIFCQTDTYSNDALRAQHYENLEKRSVYGSAPITHLNPSSNKISYALGVEFPNFVITPDTEHPDYIENSNVNSSLELSGWSASPHLSVSLKNIGLGFSVGRGERKSLYQYEVESYSTSKQESKLIYGDVGLFLYFVPFPKLSRGLRATFILGGRSINAKHTVSPYNTVFEGGSPSVVAGKIYRYNVNEMNAGIDLKFSLLKRFSIIPWADYRHIDTSTIEAVVDDEGTTMHSTLLSSDIELFWHDTPKLRYGIDFSVQIMRLEVNIGGLLGALALSGQGKDSIEDNSISINVSWHQKGN